MQCDVHEMNRFPNLSTRRAEGTPNSRPLEPKNFQKESSLIVSKCLYLARFGRPDILWSVNKLARAVTKWTQACDRRLARLISCIHHTNDNRQCCHEGNTAQHCRLALFQDSDFACDLEDSKSTLGGILHMSSEINRTFVSICWLCEK